MPWDIKTRGGKHVVVKRSTGKVVGTHSTYVDALRQLRAIHANYKGKS